MLQHPYFKDRGCTCI